MLSNYLLILFCVAVVFERLRKKYLSIIRELDMVDDIVSIKKIVRRKRIMLGTFLSLLFSSTLIIPPAILFLTLPVESPKTGETIKAVLAIIILLFVVMTCMFLLVYRSYRGNISILSKEDFFKSTSNYALYLRAFCKDDYSYTRGRKINKRQFSEYLFTKLLSNKTKCIGVGMKNELDSPFGAMRIYVNDNTWKTDVIDLMRKADIIFILLSNRPSCMWESINAKEYIDKVVFITDDIDTYRLVKDQIKDTLVFPDISDNSKQHCFFYYLRMRGEEMSFRPFTNSKQGYNEMINETMNFF